MADSDKTGNLIEGKYKFSELVNAEKLESFFRLFTGASGFTASIILLPEHQLLIKAGCRKLCNDIQCLDPSCPAECVTEDLLLDSEIHEIDDLTLRISRIGLADGAIPVYVRGVHTANIISGHVFFEKPDMDKLLIHSESKTFDEYLLMMGGIQNIPVVTEDMLKSSLFLLRDITSLFAEQSLTQFYEKEIRENLRKSEQLFRGMANSIPGIVYQFYVRPDGSMGLYYVSDISKEIIGVDNNTDGYFQRVCEVIVPEERESFINSISTAVKEFKTWQYETRITTPSGEEKYIMGISHPEHSGDEIIFNGVILDVTARRKIEDSLHESEARYREIFEDSTVGIFQSTPEGRYRLVNRAFAEMFGFDTPEQMISEINDIATQIYVNPAERELVKKELTDNGYFRNLEVEFKKRDGKKFWASINGIAAKDRKGEFAYFHETMIDITDRKKAEDALRRNEERYRMIIDFTGQLTYDRDIEQKYTYWGGRAFDITGYSLSRLESMRIEKLIEIIHPDDREKVRQEYIKARNEHRIFSAEYRFKKSDGTYINVEDTGSFIYDDEGHPVRMLGVIKDITDRITAEEERLELERRILYGQKMESLGIMAGGIAHDFNNLLMGIMGSIEIAMLGVDTKSDLYRNLKRAMNASKRAADITGQMLAYSGRGHFMITSVNPAAALSGMSDILRSSINKTINLTIDIPQELPFILADEGQFQQIMMNLVSNASEAIGDNPGEIKITAGIDKITETHLSKNHIASSINPGSYLVIEVSDNGCGMDENIKEQIFEPFFTTKQTGRGMGMPAVQGIMKGHNGGLTVESIKGSGTRVKAYFPITVNEKDNYSQSCELKPATDNVTEAKGNILVVDDEKLVMELCIDFVNLLGLDAVGAADGEMGVQYFREHTDEILCVLLDLSMPKMDGFLTFREIKKINPSVPVILCSGYSEEDATKSFGGEGLAGFLQKPYRLESLRDKLKAIIKNHDFE